MTAVRCLLCMIVCSASAFANGPSTAILFWLADQGDNGRYAEVAFDQPLAHAPINTSVHVYTEPSKHELTVQDTRLQLGNPQTLIIRWSTNVLPDEGDTGTKIVFDRVQFAGASPATIVNVQIAGELYTRGGVERFIAQRNKEFEDAIAVAKTTQEHDIFAGLSVAAPTNGQTAGDADLHFNGWLSENMFAGLGLNRSSADGADPKQFDITMTYRKVIPFLFGSPGGQKTSRSAILTNKDANAASARHLLGILIDAAGRFEGDATTFAVTNAVFNLPIQLASRTMGFGATGKNGYWRFRLQPAGVETGQNLGSDNPTLHQYTILRYAYGGTLGLTYDKHDPAALPSRITLDLTAAGRYLFNPEATWDATTQKAGGIVRGFQPWYNADLKLYLFQSDKTRVGFRITFIRGSVPPVFNQTRAFRYGVIFETTDDQTSQGKRGK